MNPFYENYNRLCAELGIQSIIKEQGKNLFQSKKPQSFTKEYEKQALAYYGNSSEIHKKITPSPKQVRESFYVVKQKE